MEWEGCSLCRGDVWCFYEGIWFFYCIFYSSSKKYPLVSSEDKKLKTWKDIKCIILFVMNFMRLVYLFISATGSYQHRFGTLFSAGWMWYILWWLMSHKNYEFIFKIWVYRWIDLGGDLECSDFGLFTLLFSLMFCIAWMKYTLFDWLYAHTKSNGCNFFKIYRLVILLFTLFHHVFCCLIFEWIF